jgi:PTH1 family peptidyl-tRNA hydrolase
VVKVICGLGNPGPLYENTRHNLGYSILDRLTKLVTIARHERQPAFDSVQIGLAERAVYLIKPLTYVNESGLAVREALKFFEVQPTELFVISDDFSLPLGTLRIRRSGSSGGHRGLESIIDTLGTTDFPRMRAGIGPLPEEVQSDHDRIREFVLSPFRDEEKEIVEIMLSRAVEAMKLVLNDSLDQAISKYNSANPTPEN